MPRALSLCVAALLVAAASLPARAAEATPSADPARPATAVRVGGSPADAAFRNAMQKSGDDFRAARAACVAGPRQERSSCVKAARDKQKQERLAAKAAHDAGSGARRARAESAGGPQP